jgi:hypothetical protein
LFVWLNTNNIFRISSSSTSTNWQLCALNWRHETMGSKIIKKQCFPQIQELGGDWWWSTWSERLRVWRHRMYQSKPNILHCFSAWGICWLLINTN